MTGNSLTLESIDFTGCTLNDEEEIVEIPEEILRPWLRCSCQRIRQHGNEGAHDGIQTIHTDCHVLPFSTPIDRNEDIPQTQRRDQTTTMSIGKLGRNVRAGRGHLGATLGGWRMLQIKVTSPQRFQTRMLDAWHAMSLFLQLNSYLLVLEMGRTYVVAN